jgi:hypothetical protein
MNELRYRDFNLTNSAKQYVARGRKKMKKIIRTRTITKTSRRLIVCHENFAATAENLERVPVHCPNCGELITPAAAALTAGTPELTEGAVEETKPRAEES